MSKIPHTETQRHRGIEDNEITRIVVDEAIRLHQALGPGLLESIYEAILSKQLAKRGLDVRRQAPICIEYEDDLYDEGFRADLVLEQRVIVELKSVESLLPVHKKQVLTYLRATGFRVGLLLNFGEALMKNGIQRIING